MYWDIPGSPIIISIGTPVLIPVGVGSGKSLGQTFIIWPNDKLKSLLTTKDIPVSVHSSVYK